MRRKNRGTTGKFMAWAFAPALLLAVLIGWSVVWWRVGTPASKTLPVVVALAGGALAAAIAAGLVFSRYLSGLKDEVRGLFSSSVNHRAPYTSVRTLLGSGADEMLRRLDADKQTLGQARMRLKRLENEVSVATDLVTRLGELNFRETPAGNDYEVLKPVADSAIRSMSLLRDFAIENARILAAARQKLSNYSSTLQTLKDGCSEVIANAEAQREQIARAFADPPPQSDERSSAPASANGLPELQQLAMRAEEESQVFKVGLALEAAKSGRTSIEALSKQAEEFSHLVCRWKSLEQEVLIQLGDSGRTHEHEGPAPAEQRSGLLAAAESAGRMLEQAREAIDTVSTQVEETQSLLGALEQRLSGWTEE